MEENYLNLNQKKCKEMRISFLAKDLDVLQLTVNDTYLEKINVHEVLVKFVLSGKDHRLSDSKLLLGPHCFHSWRIIPDVLFVAEISRPPEISFKLVFGVEWETINLIDRPSIFSLRNASYQAPAALFYITLSR